MTQTTEKLKTKKLLRHTGLVSRVRFWKTKVSVIVAPKFRKFTKLRLVKLAVEAMRRYFAWKHSWKVSTVLVVIVFTVVLLNLTVLRAQADVATITPDSDISASGWSTGGTSDGTCAGGTFCDFVDEGATDNTSDYITTAGSTAGGESVEFGISNQPNILSATKLTLRVYAQSATNANGGTLDTISINLRINNVLQTAQSCTPSPVGFVACTATYNGSWAQADIDSAEAVITRQVQGGGNPSSRADEIQIANIYYSLTYEPSLTLGQSAYRWFSNQDASAMLTFANAYSGSSGFDDGNSITLTSDGGYVVAGSTTSFGDGGQDMYLAKYDSVGNLTWAQTWGGPSDDVGNSVSQTDDDGYAVTGRTRSFGDSGYYMFFVKYDSNGNLIWDVTWDGADESAGEDVIQDSDGNFVITGSATTRNFSGGPDNDDMFIAKYDSNGNLLWDTIWHNDIDDTGYSVVQTTDGSYAVAGHTGSSSGNYYYAFLAKFNSSSGTLSWDTRWGDNTAPFGMTSFYAYSIIQNNDGDYVMTGKTDANGAGDDMFIAKFDSAGELLWDTIWGGPADDRGSSLTLAGDSYVVVGTTSSFGAGGRDVFIAKFNSSGGLIWDRTLGGSTDEFGSSVLHTNDGGYAITGITTIADSSYEILLAKLNDQGVMVNCASPTCQDPSVITSSLDVLDSELTAATSSPAATSPSPSAITGSAAFTATVIVTVNPISAEIGIGSPLTISQDAAATAPSEGTAFRLRLDIHADGAFIDVGNLSFKLQYAPKGGAGTCSAVSSGWQDVATDSGVIRYYDNPLASNGMLPSANANDPIHGVDPLVRQSYQEAGTTTFTNSTTISSGEDGMWDFALVANQSIQNTNYCFKVVQADGSDFATYSVYPELAIPPAQFTQASYRWYNPEPNGAAQTFINAYGDTNSEWAISLAKTTDDGYVVTGRTNSNDTGNYDMLIAKYNSSGALSWTKTWGGAGDDEGEDIIQTTGGGYAVIGSTTSFGAGSDDLFLAKYDPSGNLSWSRTLGGARSDKGYSLVQTNDDGYAITGYTTNEVSLTADLLVAKYDSSGNLIWSDSVGGNGSVSEYGYSIIQNSDGDYVVTGLTSTYGSGGNDMFLVKYASNGTFSWSRTWGGLNNDHGKSVIQTNDGGYAITGSTLNYGGGGWDMFLAKYDEFGGLLWSRTWGGSDDDYGESVIQTNDGGYAITGQTNSYDVLGGDVFLTKYEDDGTISWSRTWGGTALEGGKSVVQTNDGGYAVAGDTQSYGDGVEILLAKYDSSGNIAGCSAPMCDSPNVSSPIPNPNTSNPIVNFAIPTVTSTSLSSYAIGGTGPAGGIIFYVDGDTFYEAAPSDQSSAAVWGCLGVDLVGAEGFAIGTGEQNTIDIEVGCSTVGTAADIAANYSLGGYSDWYLPSLNEFSELHAQIETVGGFADDYYWTSTEDGQQDPAFYANIIAMPTGGEGVMGKDSNLPVRSIRSFIAQAVITDSPSMATTVIIASPPSVGSPLADQNTPLDLTRLTPLNLRLALRVDNSGIDLSGQAFKLQYAIKQDVDTCAAMLPASYNDITTSTPIAYYDDSRYSDGQVITENPNDPSDGTRDMKPQTYEELNNFTNGQTAIYSGEDGIWQFTLVIDNATLKGRNFCLRVATDTDSMLTALNVADIAYAPQMYQLMGSGNWFNRSGIKQNLIL